MLFAVRAGQGFTDEVVTFVGRLLTLSRKQASELVVQAGGRVESELVPDTTLVVLGADASPGVAGVDAETERRLRRAAERAQQTGVTLEVVPEDVFCERVGGVTPTTLRSQFYGCASIRAMYPAVRDEHLRDFEKWGLLRAVVRTPGETWYGFADVAVIKQAHEDLARGAGVKTVIRNFVAARSGQLPLDFRPRTESSSRVVRLAARASRSTVEHAPGPRTSATEDLDAAETLFGEASGMDTADSSVRAQAMALYRRALALAPHLVPAVVNLANLHYADEHLPEAQALYLHAALTDPDCFEAHFNLGNLLHDMGRFGEAESCYREAVRIDPRYAEAHFYLAVTLEKQNRSQEARPHWRRYQELAPDGEWVALAREFTDS